MANRERQRRFEALLREHRRIVFKVAAAYAGGVHDRDDLAQEIAVQLWRSFGRFDERRARFSTWMYRVALNVAISQLRQARRSGADHVERLDGALGENIVDTDAAPHEAVERDERVAALRAFIGGLNALDRALVLLYLDGHEYAGIAEVLGISETNVATKLNRIKQKLRIGMAPARDEGVKNGTR